LSPFDDRVIPRRDFLGKIERSRADDARLVGLRHAAKDLKDLGALEAPKPLDHFDTDVWTWIGEKLAEVRDRAGIADAAEGLDGGPAYLGIAQQRDDAVDSARIAQASERLHGGAPNPPISVVQQADGRRDNSLVFEGRSDRERGRADVAVGIAEQLEG